MEHKDQTREVVAKELQDLAEQCERKTKKFKELGDHSAVKLGTFLTTYLRDAAETWAS